MANDTGSSYWFIPGVEPVTPAPVTPPPTTEPVSPFEKYLIALENLQPAVELFPSSTQQPSAPVFTPMAAPAAVQVSPASKFGPVTRSGYAMAPVDPMSYYSTPEPVQQSAPNPNASRRWTDFKTPTPDLSNAGTLTPESTQGGAATSTQESQSTPSFLDQPSTLDTIDENYRLTDEGWINTIANPNFKEPRVVPNPPRVGLPPVPPGMIEPVFDADNWQWLDRRIKAPTNPVTPAPPKQDENVKGVTPEEESQMIGNQTPNVPGGQGETVTPGKEGAIDRPYTVIEDIIRTVRNEVPKAPTYEFKDYVRPTYTGTTRKPGEVIPFKMPTEVPIPGRRTAELLAPGYFKDVNYDPEQILAAAMRVLRGRGAGRSLME